MTETAIETTTVNKISDADLVQACCRALDNKKAENIKVLFLGQKSTVADYFVIATGTSNPHLRALRIALEKELDSHKAGILGMDMNTDSGWVVVDASNIIFHIFTRQMRDLYSLESLWKDAEEISFVAPKPVVQEAPKATVKKPVVAKKPAAKKPASKKVAKPAAKNAVKKAATKVVAKATAKKPAKAAPKKAAPKKVASKVAAKPAKKVVAKAKAKAVDTKPAKKPVVKKAVAKAVKKPAAKVAKVTTKKAAPAKAKPVAKPAAKKAVKKAPTKAAAKKKTK